MNPILRAAVDLQKLLLEQKWKFCFIGGLAVLRWGKPRTTQGVDVSLFVPLGKENEPVDAILRKFAARISDAGKFALESRVILAQSADGIAYDIALAQFDFEEDIIDRATFYEFSDEAILLTISAEDLVVMKLFAGRDQDWLDVRGIIDANNQLNIGFVRSQLKQLIELQPENPALQTVDRILDSDN